MANCLLVQKVQSLSTNLEGYLPDKFASQQNPHITTGSWEYLLPVAEDEGILQQREECEAQLLNHPALQAP